LLATGTTLAGYRLDSVLGKGGMGVVYEATQLSLSRTVALKVLAPHLSDDDAFRERFRREGKIQAGIDHPNIVTVYDVGETEHGLFIAMRLVRGSTLKDMILAGDLDPARSLAILRPVADALDTAHEADLIHRDVKPQNVLVTGRGHAYLADFGLTKATGDTGLTQTGHFVGTLDYISPEQIGGDDVTGRSDVYALTAMLYECLTGTVPYARDSDVAVLYAHMSDAPPKVSEARPDLPGELDEVVAQGMAKDPSQRFPSAGALLEAADRILGERARAAAPEAPKEAADTVRAEAAALPETQAGLPETQPASGQPAAADETVKAGLPETVKAAASPAPDLAQTAPAAAPVAAPPADAPERAGRPPWRIIAIAAAVVVVAVVGVLIGSSGSSGGSGGGGTKASEGALQLQAPRGWVRPESRTTIPGLPISDQIALAPEQPVDGEGLVAGRVDAGGRLLLPAKFVDRLPAEPKSETVRLGPLQAYRYSGLAPKDLRQRVTLYTVPVSGGVATVACLFGEHTPSRFRAECERAAGSLQLTSGKHYPVGPSLSYARNLKDTMVPLNAAIKSGDARLSAAKTPAAQQSAAAALSTAFGTAASRLGKLELSPTDAGANRALVTALRDSSSDYSAAAAAARKGDRVAYNRAGSAIKKDAQATSRAVAAVEELGYLIG
jgi:serine/threonine-protein kinase